MSLPNGNPILKRLAHGPRPIKNTVPPPAQRHRRPKGPIPSENLSTAKIQQRQHRKSKREVNEYFAKTVALYIEEVEKTGKTPTKCNHWTDLLKVQKWLATQPLLFHMPQSTGTMALEWGLDFRLSMAHRWTKRAIKYSVEHLSAIIVLCGNTGMNDPLTKQKATDKLHELHPGVAVLKSFPTVPPRPK